MRNMFNRNYINMKRYKEIMTVLYRYGFGVYLNKIGRRTLVVRRLFKEKKSVETMPRGKRLKIALEELGPTFIKLGQIFSTRYDMLPKDIVDSLTELQDEVTEFSLEEAKRIFKSETGKSTDQAFASFDDKPMAAASIGQVYRAVTKDGKRVVVKIQRPNIEKIIETDIAILKSMANMADERLKISEMFKVGDMINEFAYYLTKELDYTYEGQNAMKFSKNFRCDSRVVIPTIYWEYTTKRVIVMEEINGIKVSDVEKIGAKGWNVKRISKNLSDVFMTQVFIHELFHGDPHPGNIMVVDESRLGFIDFGIVGIVDNRTKKFMVSMLKASRDKNVDDFVEGLLEIGSVSSEVNEEELKRDLYFIMSHYYDMPIEKINISEVLNEIMKVSFKHELKLPSQLTLLIKSSITIEGSIRKLEPNFSPKDISDDIIRRIYREKLSFKKSSIDMMKMAYDGYDNLRLFPKRLNKIVENAEKNKLKLNLSYENEEKLIEKLDGISKGITFGVITGSLVIGSTIILGTGMTQYGRVIEYMVKVSFLSSFIIGNIYIWGYVFKRR